MTVQALIQAAGIGTRLGCGPKAFVILGGRTLLERAVEIFQDLVESTIVAVPAPYMERAHKLIGNEQITLIEGGATRSDTTRRLLSEATAPWLVLHDVVHPFATRKLVENLLDAAYRYQASAPGLENTEYIYDRDGNLLHAPGDVLVGQKPVAFSREAVDSAYLEVQKLTVDRDPSLIQIFELAGIRTRFLPGCARNIKITGPADLQFAEAMIAMETGNQPA